MHHTALRVEWAKCKARSSRWHENLEVLEEEMRRVCAYSVKKEAWWRALPAQRPDVDAALSDGLLAYAMEHADLEAQYRIKTEHKWKATRGRVQMVLANLAQPGIPPLTSDGMVEVEVEFEFDSRDDNGGGADFTGEEDDDHAGEAAQPTNGAAAE